jgi:hypothetical protein
MNRLLTVVAASGAICVAAQAPAADTDNQSTMSERQLISQIAGCMRARMSANKDGSYKDAFKACKNQLTKGTPDTAVVSGTQAKP